MNATPNYKVPVLFCPLFTYLPLCCLRMYLKTCVSERLHVYLMNHLVSFLIYLIIFILKMYQIYVYQSFLLQYVAYEISWKDNTLLSFDVVIVFCFVFAEKHNLGHMARKQEGLVWLTSFLTNLKQYQVSKQPHLLKLWDI
jgi:hypothetical protein